jgi:hypothetical protein
MVPRPPPTDLQYARPSSRHSSGSVSPRTTLRPASPDPASSGPRKLARIGYEHYSPTTGRQSPLAPTPDAARPAAFSWRQQPEALPRIHDDVLLRRAWHTDSYVGKRHPL